MSKSMKGLNTIFENNCLPAHRRSTYFFLFYWITTNNLAERSRMVSCLFLKCSSTTESKSELSSARLIFSQLYYKRGTEKSPILPVWEFSIWGYRSISKANMSFWCSVGLRRRIAAYWLDFQCSLNGFCDDWWVYPRKCVRAFISVTIIKLEYKIMKA